MFKLQNLNVVRIVNTEEEKSQLETQGFKVIGKISPEYDKLTLNDLRQMAKEKEVDGYSTMKKEDLIAVLKGLDK